MTSKERIKRAVLFEGPDRIPHDLPPQWGSDFIYISANPDPDWIPGTDGEDEWGCVWQKVTEDKTMGQVKIHPLDDYNKLQVYKFPNFDMNVRYEKARQVVSDNIEDKFIIADIPLNLIHRLEYLRGNEQAWMDPYIFPDELEVLLDKFVDIAIDAVKHFSDIGADGILSSDDWGVQDRLLMDPAVFRQFFKPRYKRVYDEAHKRGMITFLHSCGNIMEILDDFIEIGLNVIQMDQQENMGVEELSKRFGGRICFWCPVDIQNKMISGTPDEVSEHAKNLIEYFGKFNGGFISKWYPSPTAVQHKWENIKAMSEAFIKFEKC